MNKDAVISPLEQTALEITGMTCAGCARTIERILSRVHGVEAAKVDFELGAGIVTGAAGAADLVAAVAKAGYGASAIDRGASGERP